MHHHTCFPSLLPLGDRLPVVYLPNVRQQLPVKHVGPDRHLELIERVLHDIVRVEIIHLANRDVHICLRRVREQQKLDARHGREALQPEVF